MHNTFHDVGPECKMKTKGSRNKTSPKPTGPESGKEASREFVSKLDNPKEEYKKHTKNVQTGIFADDNTPNLKLQGEEFDRLRTGLFVVNLAAESPIVCPSSAQLEAASCIKKTEG